MKNFTLSYEFEKYKQNLDFNIIRDFFIEMKYYTVQNSLQKMYACWTLILDINLALNRYCLWSWCYSAHAMRHSIVLFFEKKFLLLPCFTFSKYVAFIWILSNSWWNYLQDLNIYNITEDHSGTASRTKNDHM